MAVDQPDIVYRLRRELGGRVRTDSAAIEAASTDFGRTVYRTPGAVVQPEGAGDVALALRCAREANGRVAVRGAGHSQGGQALSCGGIVIETRCMDAIDASSISEGWLTVGAGATWGDVVRVAAAHAMLPPVLTDHTQVTIGGTLSVGGAGPASFREGMQLHHCLGLELVLGTGEVVWVDRTNRPELYASALGTLGQYGVMTRARLALRRFAPYTQTVRLTYRGLTGFLRDAERLMQLPEVTGVEGFARGSLGESGRTDGKSRRYVLEVSTVLEDACQDRSRPITATAGAAVDATTIVRDTLDYARRLETAFAQYRRPVHRDRARPWVEHFLPFEAVPEYVKVVNREFPAANLLLWPMVTARLAHPSVALPPEPLVVLVGILASVRPEELPQVLPRLRMATELGYALGGKRYLSGWLDFDERQWRTHYGDSKWEEMKRRKQRWDPQNVLGGPAAERRQTV